MSVRSNELNGLRTSLERLAMKTVNDKRKCVNDTDRCHLGQLLANPESRAWGDRRCRARLEAVLERAEPVDSHATPENLVTMNPTAELVDLATEKRRTVTVVYPDDVDLVPDGVSIFEPLGATLLGCKVGDVIECSAEKRQCRFRIVELVYQPEHAGAFNR